MVGRVFPNDKRAALSKLISRFDMLSNRLLEYGYYLSTVWHFVYCSLLLNDLNFGLATWVGGYQRL